MHLRPGVEGIEHLKEHQRRKRHGPPVLNSAGPLDPTAGQRGIEDQQGAGRHHNADESDTGAHATVDDTLAAGAGSLAHQIRVRRVNAERERGRTIG